MMHYGSVFIKYIYCHLTVIKPTRFIVFYQNLSYFNRKKYTYLTKTIHYISGLCQFWPKLSTRKYLNNIFQQNCQGKSTKMIKCRVIICSFKQTYCSLKLGFCMLMKWFMLSYKS